MGLLADIWVDWAAPVNGVITAPEAPGHGLKVKPVDREGLQGRIDTQRTAAG